MAKVKELKCKPSEQYGEIIKRTSKLEKGEEKQFLTVKGIVKVRQNESRTTFYLEGNMINKASLMSMLSNGKLLTKQKKIDKEAKQKLLLTLKQLETNYKVKSLLHSLDSRQYGTKKQRKQITKNLKDVKTIKGNDILKEMVKVFGDVPTHDLFSIFEHMENFKSLMKVSNK